MWTIYDINNLTMILQKIISQSMNFYLERLQIISQNAIFTYFKLDKSPGNQFFNSFIIGTFFYSTYYFNNVLDSEKSGVLNNTKINLIFIKIYFFVRWCFHPKFIFLFFPSSLIHDSNYYVVCIKFKYWKLDGISAS